MRRISTATRVVDKFGAGKPGFTNGNAVTGVMATDLEDVWFDHVQEELASFIEWAGLQLSNGDTTQFRQALQKKFALLDSLGNLSGSVAVSTSTVLGSNHWGKRIEITASVTVTFPLASSVPSGTAVLVTASNGASVSIATAGGQVLAFNNTAVPTPYSMSGGGSFLVVSDGAVWRCHLGTEELRTSPLFSASLQQNGYQKLPSGFIVQWGQNPGSASGPLTYSYPIAFPKGVAALCCTTNNVNTQFVGRAFYVNNTQFSIGNSSGTGQWAADLVGWIAIGY